MPRDTGARHRILRHLREYGSVQDRSGRATHELKDAVGYEGSTVGFTQLLASMASAGMIVRDVRGKRTYRISLPVEARVREPADLVDGTHEAAAVGDEGTVRATSIEHIAGSTDVDYDQLASRLLRQVARNLSDQSGGSAAAQRKIRSLEARVTELEREIARTRAERNQAAEERDEAQERLRAAESNLSTLTDRMGQRRGDTGGRPPATHGSESLDNEERALLRRLSSA